MALSSSQAPMHYCWMADLSRSGGKQLWGLPLAPPLLSPRSFNYRRETTNTRNFLVGRLPYPTRRSGTRKFRNLARRIKRKQANYRILTSIHVFERKGMIVVISSMIFFIFLVCALILSNKFFMINFIIKKIIIGSSSPVTSSKHISVFKKNKNK